MEEELHGGRPQTKFLHIKNLYKLYENNKIHSVFKFYTFFTSVNDQNKDGTHLSLVSSLLKIFFIFLLVPFLKLYKLNYPKK